MTTRTRKRTLTKTRRDWSRPRPRPEKTRRGREWGRLSFMECIPLSQGLYGGTGFRGLKSGRSQGRVCDPGSRPRHEVDRWRLDDGEDLRAFRQGELGSGGTGDEGREAGARAGEDDPHEGSL